jgi:hypothetical protein
MGGLRGEGAGAVLEVDADRAPLGGREPLERHHEEVVPAVSVEVRQLRGDAAALAGERGQCKELLRVRCVREGGAA